MLTSSSYKVSKSVKVSELANIYLTFVFRRTLRYTDCGKSKRGETVDFLICVEMCPKYLLHRSGLMPNSESPIYRKGEVCEQPSNASPKVWGGKRHYMDGSARDNGSRRRSYPSDRLLQSGGGKYRSPELPDTFCYKCNKPSA